MDRHVVFEEDANAVFRTPPVRSAEHRLVDRGIAHTTARAKILLVLLGVCLLGGAFYFLASVIPETPKLGNDILRPGEHLPLNRSL